MKTLPTGEQYCKAIAIVCLDKANRTKDCVEIGYLIQAEATCLMDAEHPPTHEDTAG
jgi:hypothetical protein